MKSPVLQKWNQPRKGRLDSKKVEDISLPQLFSSIHSSVKLKGKTFSTSKKESHMLLIHIEMTVCLVHHQHNSQIHFYP